MAKIKFEGHEFEYDEAALKRYSIIKAMSNYKENPPAVFGAFEVVFKGHDVEYAESLGDDMEKMAELFGAVMEAAGEEAKN